MDSDHILADILVYAASEGEVEVFSDPLVEAARAPRFILGNPSKALLKELFSQHDILGTYVFKLNNVAVSHEGLVSKDKQILSSRELGFDSHYLSSRHYNARHQLEEFSSVSIEEPVVVLSGPGHLVYGHWLVDFLPKLYLLHQARYNLGILKYLLPADTPHFALDWLDVLGIPLTNLVFYDRLTTSVQCRTLIVPTCLRYGSRVASNFRDARDYLVNRIGGYSLPKTRQKICVTRSSNASTLNQRYLLQREIFQTTAMNYGYQLFSPELHSVREQISVFSSAGSICGEYGSGLHNSLFCNAPANVLSVRNDEIGLGVLQSDIDAACGNMPSYIIGSTKNETSFSVRAKDLTLAFQLLDDTQRTITRPTA